MTCDGGDRTDEACERHATLIVEVLSDSTAGYDRGEKFAVDRTVESLREDVVIAAARRTVECYRRDETGHRVLYGFSAGDTVEF